MRNCETIKSFVEFAQTFFLWSGHPLFDLQDLFFLLQSVGVVDEQFIFPGSSMVEQLTVNQLVTGSSPVLGAKKIKHLFLGVLFCFIFSWSETRMGKGSGKQMFPCGGWHGEARRKTEGFRDVRLFCPGSKLRKAFV